MSTSLNDSVLPLSQDTLSDNDFTAQTAQETVMAEQISHNVVNYPESASDSLVDVAANQTTAPSVDYDSTTEHFPETKNFLEASQSANEHAFQANSVTSTMPAEAQAIFEAQASADDTTESVGQADIQAESTALDNNGNEYEQLVNGVHDAAASRDIVGDDEGIHDGSVDVSVNSDTEGSRGDAQESHKDEKHHVRSNSVKKPTSFSKVSVTKNFLAKSATTTPPVAKPGDKPSPAGSPALLSASKPRLVAKTGTQIRDLQKARLGTETAGGPDASKVWNKNRPVAPPPPRQFTDEELKQQYGIHLATRLQTDENGKESKWADIDDDEDDWAPDTVVWMDGTKSTLTPTETAALAQKEQQPVAVQLAKPGEGTKPVLALKRPTEPGPTKTILKPGASAAAAQARQSESGTGTPTDKASLLAKSSAAAPAKSPWAPLPPVEKVSPVNPPVQQKLPSSLPFQSQDARAYEPSLPPPPAREIAADTFDRSWREGEGGTRELFNSANGRYESVQEGGRRGSVKPDSSHRKPSVLQRPSPSAAPAEPSAAFQTRSTSQMDGQWARRRGSSVSQGSLQSGRRMSMSKTSEISPAPERRTSTVIGHDMRTSPKMPRNEPVQPPVFPQQSAWQQQMPPQPESLGDAEAIEDPVKVQERVMREKRELAKKRREEEEARLEAEKQERLKAKLASLGAAGKSRKEREAEAAAAAAAVQTPASETAPGSALIAPPTDETQANAEASAITAPALEAQSSESAMDTALPRQLTEEEILPAPIPQRDQTVGLMERSISSTDQNAREQPRQQLSPRANPRAPFQPPGASYKPSPSSYSSPGDRKQQPFGRSPLPNNDAFTPWGTTAPNGNVWGSSGIGNGTFESANVFAPMPTSQQGSALPPPPGMGRGPGSSRISPQSLGSESRSPNLQQQSVPEPPRGFGPPGFETHPSSFAGQGRVNGPSPAPGLGRQTHLPGPIAPPSRAQPPQQQQAPQRQDPLSAWNSAAQRLPQQYRSDAEAAEKKPREAVGSAPRDDTFKETFRQTASDQGRLGAPRRYDKTEYTVHDAQGTRSVQSLSPVPPSSQTQPSGPFTTTSPMPHDPRRMPNENNVRIPDPSPNPAQGGLPTQLPPIGPPPSQQQQPISVSQTNASVSASTLPPAPDAKDPSPPPPETMSHPVNSGDASHPLVRLPPEKPKVKLPPAAAPAQSPPTQPTSVALPPRPIQNWGAPGSSKPIVMQEAWQTRFNSLFNRATVHTEIPPSPPKTPPKMQGPALAVTSSSRTAMDEVSAATSATVSLPQSKRVTSVEGFTIDDSEDVISKPTIEQMFNEELSFGSAPKVGLKNAFPVETFDEPPTHDLLKMGPGSTDLPPATNPQSVSEFDVMDLRQKRAEGYFVHLPELKLFKRMARHQNGSRASSSTTNQERKPSGKYKGKGKESAPNSSGANSAKPNGSRKTSFQKGQTPVSNSPTPSNGPAADTLKKPTWAKPPKGRGRGPATVKAA